MMSVASSKPRPIDWNSWQHPSIFPAVMAAPSIEDSRTRRSALPIVVRSRVRTACAQKLAVLVSRLEVSCETFGS